jgi:hypothetical protein
MLLTNAQVKMFKSIEDSESVTIDDSVTVLVVKMKLVKLLFFSTA